MRYLADVLTVFRALMSLVVLFAGLQGNWSTATAALIAGILSDAFDGMAARKWPYTPLENQRYWWRKDPHAFDMTADGCLWFASLIVTTFSLVTFNVGVVVLLVWAAVTGVIQVTVIRYKKSRPRLGDKLELRLLRYPSVLTYAVMLVHMTREASSNWLAITAFYGAIALPLLWIKRDRIKTV